MEVLETFSYDQNDFVHRCIALNLISSMSWTRTDGRDECFLMTSSQRINFHCQNKFNENFLKDKWSIVDKMFFFLVSDYFETGLKSSMDPTQPIRVW